MLSKLWHWQICTSVLTRVDFWDQATSLVMGINRLGPGLNGRRHLSHRPFESNATSSLKQYISQILNSNHTHCLYSLTGKFCGTGKLPGTLVSSDSRMWIQYKASGGTTHKGFVANYEGQTIYLNCRSSWILELSIFIADYQWSFDLSHEEQRQWRFDVWSSAKYQNNFKMQCSSSSKNGLQSQKWESSFASRFFLKSFWFVSLLKW